MAERPLLSKNWERIRRRRRRRVPRGLTRGRTPITGKLIKPSEDNSSPRNTESYRKRGLYFKVLRSERLLLKQLSMIVLSPMEFSKKDRSFYRKIYYSILPFLFKVLWWPPDISLLAQICEAVKLQLDTTKLLRVTSRFEKCLTIVKAYFRYWDGSFQELD
jgi:hypothetical protein